ncbi:hypothetical protein IU479_31920 [Nocardia abscessus]|uniref:hypothetical protein n=1 Tax=Nocardia TaxID=1817 RepID=UPI001572C5DB|nr:MULTISPECIES: hypothetical protein [Nocardia]MBF6222697.1 hypothetical protein [Nocardia abscessus]MDE1671221.1 hypothetical protein [Nocardia gipuzkoensis]
MGNLSNILYGVLIFVRWGGMIIIAIVTIGVLISEGAKSKLSPARIVVVFGSGLLAGVAIWILPTTINYARTDANLIVPDHPIGGYR